MCACMNLDLHDMEYDMICQTEKQHTRMKTVPFLSSNFAEYTQKDKVQMEGVSAVMTLTVLVHTIMIQNLIKNVREEIKVVYVQEVLLST